MIERSVVQRGREKMLCIPFRVLSMKLGPYFILLLLPFFGL